LVGKIGAMGLVIAEFTVLGLAIGAIISTGIGALILGAGGTAMIAIAGEIVVLAEAMRTLDENVPSTSTGLVSKVSNIALVIQAIVSSNIGGIIGNSYKAAALAPVIAIVDEYVELAFQLNKLQKIILFVPLIVANVKLIKDTVDFLNSSSNTLQNIFNSLIEIVKTLSAKTIIDVYLNLATELNTLQDIFLYRPAIVKNVQLIKDTVDFLSDSGNSLKNVFDSLIEVVKTLSAKTIVDAYINIANNLNTLQGVSLKSDIIDDKISLLSGIVKRLGSSQEGSLILALSDAATAWLNSKATENAGVILKSYIGIVDSVSDINKKLENFSSKAILKNIDTLVVVIRKVLDTGTGGVFGAIQQFFNASINASTVDGVKNTVVSLGKLAQAINEAIDIGGENYNKIDHYKTITEKLLSIRDGTGGSIFDGGFINSGVVDGIKNTVMSFSLLAQAINGAVDIGGENYGKIDHYSIILEHLNTLRDNTAATLGNSGFINSGVVDGMKNTIISFGFLAMAINQAVDTSPDNYAKLDHYRIILDKISLLRDTTTQGGAGFINSGVVDGMLNTLKSLSILVTYINSQLPDMAPENYFGENSKLGHIRQAIAMIMSIGYMSQEQKAALDITIDAATEVASKFINLVNILNSQLPGVGGDVIFFGPGGKLFDIAHVLSMILSIPGMTDEQKVKLVNTANAAADVASTFARFVSIVNSTSAINTGAAQAMFVAGTQVVNGFINGIQSTLGALYTEALNLQGTVWNAVQPKLVDEFYQGAALTQSFIDGLRSLFGALSQSGADIQGTIWNAIESKLKDEYYQGAALGRNFNDGINSNLQNFYNSGTYAVQGFVDGANNTTNAKKSIVYAAGQSIASKFLAGLSRTGLEGSPWKTTYKSGAFAGEGFINGLESTLDKVSSISKQIAQAAITPMKDLGSMSLSVSGQGSEGTLGGVSSKSNTIIMNNNIYSNSDFNQMSRDIMFNMGRL
jgi:hypothetical protein